MINTLLLGKYIKRFITEDEYLYSKLGNKIWPIMAISYKDKPVIRPFITYGRTSLTAATTKDGRTYDKASISFYVVTEDYDESIDIANALRKCFEYGTFKDETIHIANITLESAVESSSENDYVQNLSFEFIVQNSY